MIGPILIGIFAGIVIGTLARWINETLVTWRPEPERPPPPPLQVPMVRLLDAPPYDYEKEESVEI